MLKSRFNDIARARVFADVLATDHVLSDGGFALLEDDWKNLKTVRAVPEGGTPNAWQTWFAALFALSNQLVPYGGAPTLERYVRSEPVARALRGAPPEVRDKVAFLLLVAARDLDGMRREGAHLLAGSLPQLDPGFSAYTLFATAAACLASTPDPSCRTVLAQLDRLPSPSPVIELLRAHKAALP
jgi:hypothetical protein